MIILVVLSNILIFSYILAVVFLFVKWKNIPEQDLPSFKNLESLLEPKLSVLIAVKNESLNINNLLESLVNQSLHKEGFEIVVVDDGSTDDTFEVVENFCKQYPTFTIQNLKSNGIGKKAAITYAVGQAKGDIMVCTDGDCVVGNDWLKSYATFFETNNAQFVFGAVTFTVPSPSDSAKSEQKLARERLFWNELQTIEFASLVGSGAASWQAGMPNMCNGANIAYRKKVFQELGGFEGNEKIPSGDDEFLMHKIFSKYPNDVYFIKSKATVVQTIACQTINEFVKQRARWASKWEHYSSWGVKAVALYVFIVNFVVSCWLLVVGYSLLFTDWSHPTFSIEYSVFSIIIGRWLVEYFFLKDVLRFMDKKLNLGAFLLLILIYPFYVVYFGIMGRLKKII